VDLCQAAGLLDPLVGHVGVGDREVVADRRVEQVDVLRDDAEQAPDVVGTVVADVGRRSGSRPRRSPRSAGAG
jgi:hypothetical protein